MTTKILIREKGSAKSGYHGHAGRPGLEGGAIPKGGSRRVYGTGKRTQSFPKGKTIPPVPKLSQGRTSGIPKHAKGDTSGAKAYQQWKSNAGTVSEADDAKMKSWFGERAKAMEFNLDIPTVVAGQRDEDEDKEPKKKEPEKKEPEKPKKGKAKKKAPAKKKEPKAKAPAKPKKAKIKPKKKGITDAERAKILKAVGVKPEIYNTLKEVEKILKAGDKPSLKQLLALRGAGLLKFNFVGVQPSIPLILQGKVKVNPSDITGIRLESFGQGLLKAVERGDAIAAQRILDKMESKKKSISIRFKGGPGSGHRGHGGRPGKRGGSSAKTSGVGNFRPGSADGKGWEGDPALSDATALSKDGEERSVASWDDASTQDRADVMRHVNRSIAEATGQPEEHINEMTGQWAATSNDSDMRSLALQQDASKEFGVPVSDWQEGKIKVREDAKKWQEDRDMRVTEENASLFSSDKQRSVLREMHKQTQEQLHEEGFRPGDSIKLYRGVKSGTMGLPNDAKGAVSYKGNAIESWSTSRSQAEHFTGFANGHVLTMNVPVENVFSTAKTGFGCLNEGEFVIFGSIPGQQANVSPSGDVGSKSISIRVREKGSAGSGDWGHRGRVGKRGGSAKGSTVQLAAGAERRTLKLKKTDERRFRPGSVRPAGESGKGDSVLNSAVARSNEGLISTIEERGESWQLVGSTTRKSVKRNINANLSDATGIPRDEVNTVILQWARTSNDNDMRSLAIQEDAAKALGVPLSEWQKGKIEGTKKIRAGQEAKGFVDDPNTPNRYKPIMSSDKQQSLIKEMHRQTQADLAAKGHKPGDTIRLYRGMEEEITPGRTPGIAQYKGNAIESWSVDKNVAEGFASSGAILTMDVPVVNIVGTAATGFGVLGEGEFVILGSLPGQSVLVNYESIGG